MKRVVLAFALALGLADCTVSEGEEVGWKTSDPARMGQLREAMKSGGIPFREDERGFIVYHKKYRQDVEAIWQNIDKALSIRFDDPALNALALTTLTEMGANPRLEKRNDGEWIAWSPKSDEEGRVQQERVRAVVMGAMSKMSAQRCKEKNSTVSADPTPGASKC